MEIMIARWIRETTDEFYKAKNNQNTLKMIEMRRLREALWEMRNKLTISNS